jgi:hypothetical protein
MTPLKSAIFTEIRTTFPDSASVDDTNLNQIIFQQPNSLRLSATGFVAVKKIFTAYSFEMPTNMKSKHQAALSKMEYPYFLTSKRLILFSEMDSMMVKLHGGIQSFLDTYTQFD